MVKTTEKKIKSQETQETTCHNLTLEEVAEKYQTDFEKGLNEDQVLQKREEFGLNELTPVKGKSQYRRLLEAIFLGLFNILLWTGAILCFIAFGLEQKEKSNLYLGVVLVAVVIITGIFMFYQESKSSKIMESFSKFLPQNVNVIRNCGVISELEANCLVPGDIVCLKSGDKIPADIRIIQCSDNTQVDNSSLTGEAEPQDRAVTAGHDDPLEAKNIAFFGTLLVRGQCKGVTIFTGDSTYMGTIANLAGTTGSTETPIGLEISSFIKKISFVAITLGIIFGIISLVDDKPKKFSDSIPTIVFVIGIIVANVPEGLLATVTVGLTLTAKTMASKAVLVKNLQAVETLGSTSTICSDKTGTLTMNVMTVSHVFYDTTEYECDTENPANGEFNTSDKSFQCLIRCAALCNNAKYKDDGTITGDASETAMLKFVNPHYDCNIESFRNSYPVSHDIPFNSANKWQVSIHKNNSDSEITTLEGSKWLLVLKGAPEKVLGFCDRVLLNGQVISMTDELINKIKNGILSCGKKGERVLGFCQLELDPNKFDEAYKFEGDSIESANFPFGRDGETGLIFLGLMSMIDPPRPGVLQAVSKCQSAGIKVIMVTGDHPVTAKAIGQKVGIIQNLTVEDIAEKQGVAVDQIKSSDAKAIVVSGSQIRERIDGKTLDEVCEFWNEVLSKDDVVFARTTPQQKLLIVKACQERGAIVAVTGDGVNDSPALKAASIGIAMGKTGTEVAKNAADMILLDDNFASIVNGVEEGRLIFDNLKKSIAYTLSSNIPEIIPFLAFVVLDIPLPLTTVLILCVDLGTDMLPAISLAYEKKESDIMERPPRDPEVDNLVTWRLISFSYLQIGMIQAVAGIYSQMYVLHLAGIRPWFLIGLEGDSNNKFFDCENSNNLYCQEEKINNKYCHYLKSDTEASALSSANFKAFDCEARKYLSRRSQTAYFISIIVVQWADLLICKTRSKSIYSQGMSGKFMMFAMVFETLLGVFLVYVPLTPIFGTVDLLFVMWLPGTIQSITIFCYDELRKLWIRKHRHGQLERNTQQ